MGAVDSVFISYRRADTGWAANQVGDALRARLGPDAVFIDNSSIALGAAFADVIESALRWCDALVVLIGPGWDVGSLLDRLHEPGDWVRREVRRARELNKLVVPVLVDRDVGPRADVLPPDVRFLPELHHRTIRQKEPETVHALAERLTSTRHSSAPAPTNGAPRTRAAIEDLLRRQLPPSQQGGGNFQRLVDHVLAVLGPDERLVFLTPARLPHRPSGSATVLVTPTDLVVTDVDEDFLTRGETRMPRAGIRRAEVVPTWFGRFADIALNTATGESVSLEHLFPAQARELADRLRETS